MTSQELRESLTEEQVIEVLESLGAVYYPLKSNNRELIFSTICHNGSSPKLYYYIDSKMFYCYTDCNCQMSIFDIVMKVKGYEQHEFHHAKKYIELVLNIDDVETGGFGNEKIRLIDDWSIIRKWQRKEQRSKYLEQKADTIKIYDKKLLDRFDELYYDEWVKEGISVDSMKKYNILYNMVNQEIIIPHYNISNDLIGVRVRNLLDERIELFGKYHPYQKGNVVYKHPLNLNLYGINHNVNAIRDKRKVMLVESEKSVMQTDSMFGDDNFTLSLSGLSFSQHQLQMLQSLNVREVILGFDKQVQMTDKEHLDEWVKMIKKRLIDVLKPYFTVYVIWDNGNLLGLKDSPTDKGKDVLLHLMKNKLLVG